MMARDTQPKWAHGRDRIMSAPESEVTTNAGQQEVPV